jgi:phage gp29-like protein
MKARGLYLPDGSFRAFSKAPDGRFVDFATREAATGFRSLTYLANPDPVLRQAGKTTRVYDELLTDDHVGSCVDTLKTGVQCLEWEIDRGLSKSRIAKEVYQILKDVDLYTFIGQIMDGDLFGWQPFEITWGFLGAGEGLYPLKVESKPRDWFVFGKNNELLFRSKRRPLGEPVPEDKFLLARHQPSYENPYGVALLSRCFWPVTFKKGGLDFWCRLAEKYGFPYAVATVPDNTDEAKADEILEMLTNLINDGVAVLGANQNAQFLEMKSGTTSHLLFNGLVDWGDKAISKVLLGQTMTTEVGQSGSRAQAEVHEKQLGKRDDAREHRVCHVVNQLIAKICDFNWPGQAAPEFRFFEERDVNKETAERDKVIFDMGWGFSEDYLMRTYAFQKGDLVQKAAAAPGPEADPNALPAPAFAEGEAFQAALDEAIAEMSDEDLQAEARQLTKPIFDLVDRAKTFAEATRGLERLFPLLNTKQLEKKIAAILTVSEVLGREEALH